MSYPFNWKIGELYRLSNVKHPGQDWRVLFAIHCLETNYSRSRLWIEGWNPGGIKYRPEYPALGHNNGFIQARDGIKYARFTDAQNAVDCHYLFLAQYRYRDALNVAPDLAVLTIHNAGYAEKSPSWLLDVTNICKAVCDMYPTDKLAWTGKGEMMPDETPKEVQPVNKPSNVLVDWILSKVNAEQLMRGLILWILERANDWIDAEIERRKKDNNG